MDRSTVKNAILSGEVFEKNAWSISIDENDDVLIFPPRGDGFKTSLGNIDKAVSDFCKKAEMPIPGVKTSHPPKDVSDTAMGGETSSDEPFTQPKVRTQDKPEGSFSDTNLGADTSSNAPFKEPAVIKRQPVNEERGGLPDPDLGEDTSSDEPNFHDKKVHVQEDGRVSGRKSAQEAYMLDPPDDPEIMEGLSAWAKRGEPSAILAEKWGNGEPVSYKDAEAAINELTDVAWDMEKSGAAKHRVAELDGLLEMLGSYVSYDEGNLHTAGRITDTFAKERVPDFYKEHKAPSAKMLEGIMDPEVWEASNYRALAQDFHMSDPDRDMDNPHRQPHGTPPLHGYDEDEYADFYDEDVAAGCHGKPKKSKKKQAAFMEPQVWEGDFVLVDDDGWVEAGYEEPEDKVIEKQHGFGAMMSAPGYMDRSELAVFDTEEEAIDYLFEYHMADMGELDEEYEEYRDLYEEYAKRQGWEDKEARRSAEQRQAAFMEPQVWEGDFVLVDDDGDEYWVPEEYLEGVVDILEKKHGWGAQLSAPGYMDQSDLDVFDTEEDAWDYLFEYYMTDEWGELDEEYREYQDEYTKFVKRDEAGVVNARRKAVSDNFDPKVNDRDPEAKDTSDIELVDRAEDSDRKEDLDEATDYAFRDKDSRKIKAGPKLREKWDDVGGYNRDLEAESAEELYHLVRSFGSEDPYDWSGYKPNMPIAPEGIEQGNSATDGKFEGDDGLGGSEAKRKSRKLRAVDDEAKKYWKDYYGEYGKELGEAEPKKRGPEKGKKDDKKDDKKESRKQARKAIRDRVKANIRRRDAKKRAQQSMNPANQPAGQNALEGAPTPPTSDLGGPPAPGAAPATPQPPQNSKPKGEELPPGTGDSGLKALGWTPEEIQLMTADEKQKILQIRLNKPGTKAPKPGEKPGEKPQGAPAGEPAQAPANPPTATPAAPGAQEPAPPTPIQARLMARRIEQKLKIRKAQQMLQEPAQAPTEAPAAAPAAPAEPAQMPAADPAAAPVDESAALGGGDEQEALRILQEVRKQEVTATDAIGVSIQKNRILADRLLEELGMSMEEARKLYGVKDTSKLFQ